MASRVSPSTCHLMTSAAGSPGRRNQQQAGQRHVSPTHSHLAPPQAWTVAAWGLRPGALRGACSARYGGLSGKIAAAVAGRIAFVLVWRLRGRFPLRSREDMKPVQIKPVVNLDVVNQVDARVGTIENVS